jgi:outer membrane immunogenic protein
MNSSPLTWRFDVIKYATVAAVATALTSTAAISGGINEPILEAVPQVTYAAPVTGWTGGYVGGNLSFGKGKVKAAGDFADALGEDFTFLKPDGASAGVRAGYDWQRGAGVFGVGAEYTFGKYKDSVSDGVGGTLNANVKNAATIFARAGYAVNDNFMAYGLLGYTWAKGTIDYNGMSESADLDGGTIGLGAEYKVNSNWSTYGEYTYTDFGTIKNTDGNLKATLGQVKLGVNYRF